MRQRRLLATVLVALVACSESPTNPAIERTLFDGQHIFRFNTFTRFGVTCALCHSTVDNSLAPGIGRRLDGWPNRDLNPGLILSLSPALQAPAAHAVLTSWGPGKYDAHWNHDNQNGPVLIPPAYGLAGVNLETYTGEGGIPYW